MLRPFSLQTLRCRTSLRLSNLRRSVHVRAQHSLLEELTERGFINDVTRKESLHDLLENGSSPVTVYAGIDPTGPALHVGHLIPLMCLMHFQLRGHQILPLIGGATALVGDPSGRVTQRELAVRQEISANADALASSVDTFFLNTASHAAKTYTSPTLPPRILNNIEWYKDFKLLEFLRVVGVHARVNTMLNKQSVQARMESQQGISFTEFTYQLLQAYDFYHLHRNHSCRIQVGGSDQWGNIVAGLEMITRLQDGVSEIEEGFGITTPLLTTASGDKFGKSAGNAVWLDSSLTSTFLFYNFFIKSTDADVEKYLKLFTFVPLERISQVLSEHQKSPEKRLAQTLLAEEVTTMVHGLSGLHSAQAVVNILFGSDHSTLKASNVLEGMKGDPSLHFIDESDAFGITIPKLAALAGLVSSNSAGKTLVDSGGLYVNGQRIRDLQFKLRQSDLIDGQLVVLRAGKDNFVVLAIRQDQTN